MCTPVHGQGAGWCPHSRPGGLPCSPLCPGQHALPASGSLTDGDPGSVPPRGLPAGPSGSCGLGPRRQAPPPLLAPSLLGEAAPDPECPTGGLLLGLGLPDHLDRCSPRAARVTWRMPSVVQSSPVRLFETPWTAARQVPLPSLVSWSLLKFMFTDAIYFS